MHEPPPQPGPIEHVIVLMLENRSYDFLFGHLGIGNGVLNGSYSNAFDGKCYPVTDAATDECSADPLHSFDDVQTQLYGTLPRTDTPSMGGFAESGAQSSVNDPQLPMDLMRPSMAPALRQLAETYLLFDAWFSAVPGPTWPNRLFAHSGTSGGTTSSTFSTADLPTIQTQLDQVSRGRATWAVYSSPNPEQKFPCVLKCNETMDPHAPQLNRSWDDLHAILEGKGGETLPSYAWVETYITEEPGGTSMHPTELISDADRFVQDLYEALRASKYWDRSLLLITFDEHGGFYDHVPPPRATPPGDASGDGTFNFERFGVRVPALAISPYAPRRVVSETMCHSSILQTVRGAFIPNAPPLTRRDAEARSVLPFLLETPRTNTPERL